MARGLDHYADTVLGADGEAVRALSAEGEARRVEGRGRVERGHERMLATVFGTVTVRRLAWRTGAPQRLPG